MNSTGNLDGPSNALVFSLCLCVSAVQFSLLASLLLNPSNRRLPTQRGLTGKILADDKRRLAGLHGGLAGEQIGQVPGT